MSSSARWRSVGCLLSVCFIVFWWRLGAIGLIDPDEPFYAQTAREMVETNDWITPKIFGQPQFEKPIAFYWMAALSFKTFGVNEFAARAPSALFATLIVLMVHAFGARFWNERAGFLSAFVLATGVEFSVMSRLMLTDIALAFFIGASIFSYWLALEKRPHETRWLFSYFFFAGLAVLTKGPIGWLIGALATGTFGIVTMRGHPLRGKWLWIGAVTYALIAIPWFAIMLWKFGWIYFDAFFIHENLMRVIRAEHPANNHFYYYAAILIGGSLPWIPMLGLTAWRAFTDKRDDRATYLLCWIATSFVFLTLVQSKLPSYIFFLFIPVAMCVGKTLDDLLSTGFRSNRERLLVAMLCLLQVTLAFATPLIKVTQPFSVPALLLGVCLLAAFVFQIFKQHRAWLGLHGGATIVLIVGALTFSREQVETMISARPIAEAVLKVHQPGQPILSDKFLARGIYFYTHCPVSVLSNKPQPFWTAHPLPVVVGREGFSQLLSQHGSAVCALRLGESPMWTKIGVFEAARHTELFGRNLLIIVGNATKD